MFQLRKPESETPEAFSALASECVDGAGLPITTLARMVQVAPHTLRAMADGSFAQYDFEAMRRSGPEGKKGRLKFLQGSYSSLSRFCSFFDLDLRSCAISCGFPGECLNYSVSKPPVNLELVLSHNELEVMLQIMNLTGSMSLSEIGSAVIRMRENKK